MAAPRPWTSSDMAVTMDQVRALLEPDEPDYDAAGAVGPEALPHLSELIVSGDPHIAAKAASLAGRIGADATETLEVAARNASPVVRVAAAEALGHLPVQEAGDALIGLVSDEDASVRQVALESVGREAPPALRSRIVDIGERDPMPHIRDLARSKAERLRRRPHASE
jgi:HEAT repeat protein